MDTREVSVCSTIHSAFTGDTVQKSVKTQDTWRTKTFPCPPLVTAFNQHMGGIDLSDQLLQYYTTQHKAMKCRRDAVPVLQNIKSQIEELLEASHGLENVSRQIHEIVTRFALCAAPWECGRMQGLP
ncbi:hypothetical protein QQF64_023960 [Cirrhinus molitorella]|uniref:PiggyBac transposable element-derived protein domain-containing protein n=1 Tax=Cirrhinus molitorella TaxID=172907 RepID=A0ABR3NKH4_9TELE